MTKKTAVVIANLGAPSHQDEVRPFLKILFSDRDIFNFPFGALGQKLFSSMISKFRAPKSAQHYAAIGGGSPLRRITDQQGQALAEYLNGQGDFTVFTAQRYWEPFISQIAEQVKQKDFDQIVLLPLYPHFSTTSTASIINEWNRSYRGDTPTHVIQRFYNHPLYLKACLRLIEAKLQEMEGTPHLLFSAHSIPVSRVKKGDTYAQEIEDHVRLIMAQLPQDMDYTLCYQSRVGPVKWLEPTVEMAVDEILEKGQKNILVFPISFVAENLETIYEVDIQKKEMALEKGVQSWERVGTMDTNPDFIQALGEVVLEVVK